MVNFCSVTARHSSSGRKANFAVLNRERHLYSAERPSRWALGHILAFPRLISAVAEWMSTTLLHMVWPYCEFRMQVWNAVHTAWWKYRTQKWRKKRHLGTIAQVCRAQFSHLRHVSTIGKKLLNCSISTCPHNVANFGPLAADIDSAVWGTSANFKAFRVLAALLYATLVVVSLTLRRWTEGTTYIRQGGHHVGHWRTL